MQERKKYILHGSLAVLLANCLLFLIKIAVGMHTKSVSVIADAFNNLSDMGSGAITLLGFFLASKPSDEAHPFGHGRIEYVSGLMVSFIILFLGIELARDAVDKILHPVSIHFSAVTLALLCLTVPIKLLLGFYNRNLGKKCQSPALIASAKDSLNDVLVTSATIISAVASLFTAFSPDGYIGLFVAAFVLWSGIGILRDTLGPLLGQAPPKELASHISQIILSCEGVQGLHDMILHNYGPDRYIASAHAEVRADCDILKIHDAIDMAERRISEELGVLITLHIDPIDTNDVLTEKLKALVLAIIRDIDPAITLHDFRVVSGDTHTNLIFDLVLPSHFPMRQAELKNRIDAALHTQNPSYYTVIVFDRSYI